MSLFNTINFLPEVFRTPQNRAFLGATLDQLVVDSVNAPLNGYIGRTFAPTYKSKDNYIPELSKNRTRYQLEPTVVVKDADKKVIFKSDYADLLHGISGSGGLINNNSRLFSSEIYNYDGNFDYDKFVNYFKYYWLPDGPAPVQIYSNQVPYSEEFTVTRSTAESGYLFSKLGEQPNTQITLARGGTYTFKVNQPGINFWLQTEPGVSGTAAGLPTVTTRQIFGVKNNGTDNGTIQFNVPQATGQDFYDGMNIAASVDVAIDAFDYTKIQNRLLSEFLTEFPSGLDGLTTQLSGKSFVFINNLQDDVYWTTPAMPTGLEAIDSSELRPGQIVKNPSRTSGWRVTLVPVTPGGTTTDYVIQIQPSLPSTALQKIFVRAGLTYASDEYWIDKNYFFKKVPIITAAREYLYYQDALAPEFVGQIRIVDNIGNAIDVDKDINGKIGYTSPNGVSFTNGLKVAFDSGVVPTSYANQEFYVEGVGTGIFLVPVNQLVVTESYGIDINIAPDYITINRGSQDRNGWSRYNRWFHVDAMAATANYNKTSIDYGPNIPARRPIIEFSPNMQLFNYGTTAIDNVDMVIFTSTDAFNEVEGHTTASVDGVPVRTGDKIVFANDYDINVKNKIWEVVIESINGVDFITLIDTKVSVASGTNVIALRGTNEGKSFNFDGTNWHISQQKSSVNQPPLFDLIDANGYSFADTTVYPNSTFIGTKNFGYKLGNGTNDTILGFPLTYQNFDNIGDIVFSNYYDTDSFTYTDNTVTVTVGTNSGYFAVNSGTSVSKKHNWVTAVEQIEQYQLFTKFYDGHVLDLPDAAGVVHQRAFMQIDVLPKSTQRSVPYIKVFVNNVLMTMGTDYKISPYGVYYIIEFLNTLTIGDKIDAQIFGNEISTIGGYYEIPKNFDLNPLNENFDIITLGQLRTHYNKLIENYTGNKSTQNTYLKAQIGTITHHSSPTIYAATFLTDPTVNFINSVNLARKEYTKFKNKFLSLCTTLPSLAYNDPVTGVDTILQNINSVKNSSFPWYYSDMVPQGGNFTTVNYTVLNVTQQNYEINSIFNNLMLSNRAVVVYHNGVQLVHDVDYTFSQLTPAITITKQLTAGDKIVIRDYFDTDGNYIPETPTKLGLYPKFKPEIYLDNTYQTPVYMIRGHDGSITPSYGDFRDQYLLELEKRIYNNIKTDYTTNEINRFSIFPGRFRDSDYTNSEFTQLLSNNFLNWVGSTTTDYSENKWYDENNSWTWNYFGIPDTIDGTPLGGTWRQIYKYFYDTDRPNLAPWEMIGFSSEPAWWKTRYGPAPYTKGNNTLWDDLEAGYIWNNGSPYNDARFARPGLSNIIPVDYAGELLPPDRVPLVSVTNSKYINSSFAVGQIGPVENAWRNSSDFPFAVQVAFALAKPAQYFSTQLDTSLLYKNKITGQFSTVDNKNISPYILKINGDTRTGTVDRTSGYINWIGDSIKNVGMDPAVTIGEYFSNMSVQLSYKVSGFTDKKLITASAEQTTPSSTNASIIIPDENYNIYLNKSVPITTVTYSAVIVERTLGGYSVSGYDLGNPFFTIIPSISNNNASQLTVNGVSAKIYKDATKSQLKIPYGTEFKTVQQVVDFLVSYQRNLTSIGLVINDFDTDLQKTKDFILSAEEFLYWSQQGWRAGTIIVLNPATSKLAVLSIYSVLDEITNSPIGCKLVDQNFKPITPTELVIVRDSIYGEATPTNISIIDVITGTSICLAKLNLVQYEHSLIFDNVDDFGDIIYVPSQGTRQYRLKLSGQKTGGWTGMLNAPGYVYSNPKILIWEIDKDYKTGDIIVFNDTYYTATYPIPAASKFEISSWTQITQTDIQTGLLSNFGHNAQKFVNFYDVDIPPQEEDLQLFSAGLIGFRQKPYLTDLGISIPNQTKFYQGYIKQKGSANSILSLTKADFENVQSTVTTYEEWAFLVGQYGDFSRNQYTEFTLDQSTFTKTPLAFTYSTVPVTGDSIIATLTSANIYNASNLNSTTTSVYNNRVDSTYMSDLPTAGFVHLDDVDSLMFNIKDATPDTVLAVGTGHKLWVAKNSSNQWDVLRVTETQLTATKLSYVLNNYAQLFFDGNHNFAVGDTLVLTEFYTTYGNYNNVYTVTGVPDGSSVTIAISPAAGNNLLYLVKNSPLLAEGTVYKLESMVTDNTLSITSMTPLNHWRDNDKVWVSNATQQGWGVYTHKRPWLANTVTRLTANTVTNNTYFGNVARISTQNNTIYVGNPALKQVQVFANIDNTYHASTTLSNANASFGKHIETAGNLVVIGAPTVGNVHVYVNTGTTITKVQTIHSANTNGSFGSSIAITPDQHYLYIGEPGTNLVQAYWTANVGANVSYTCIGTFGTGTGNVGHVVRTNTIGNIIVVGAPNATNVSTYNGNVYVYTRSANTFSTTPQTLTSQWHNTSANFGVSLGIDASAGNLFVGAQGSTQSGIANGRVERYIRNNGSYVFQEYLKHPNEEIGYFGSSIRVSNDGSAVLISSNGSAGHEETTFDNNTTVIDESSTLFVDAVFDSGAVYLFEPLIDRATPGHIGTYIYGQELSTDITSNDQFGIGTDISLDGTKIVIGAIGDNKNSGVVHLFNNPASNTVWTLTREEEPQVDINSINRTFIYNKTNNNILAAIDFIDPKKGKLLNAFGKDIDYIRIADPAMYNAGTGNVVTDFHWGPKQIGKIWWNLDNFRYIEYEQDDLTYRLNHWGEIFEGSTVDVYQWVESLVPPSQYTGIGTPYLIDDSAYSTYGYVDQNGNVHLRYYFWVSGVDTIPDGKTNSVISITAGIKNPQAQGITYSTVLRDDSLALYNVNNLLTGKNSVLHVEKRTIDAGLLHSEYSLVQEGNPVSRIPPILLSKLVDSLAGQDAAGNQVPDPALSPAQAYGVSVNPRQGMFMDRNTALLNYISTVNQMLLKYPVTERKVLTGLNSSEPAPNSLSGEYIVTVSSYAELNYIRAIDSNGDSILSDDYCVLVSNDETESSKWSIYCWNSSTKTWSKIRTQSYKTNLYWTYTDWYDTTFDPTTTINYTVANKLDFGKLTLVPDTYVKILDSGSGNFTIYYIDSTLTQNLVGIENGTLQINTSGIPATELRAILVAIQTQILIDDLATEFNQVFFLLVKYALTEQKNLEWVFKTSFLSATQYIRKLQQFPSYIPDNQDYYLEYMNEVKPYRTILREFVVDYVGNDTYGADITDFDLPPYWDSDLSVYRSPSGEQPFDAALLTSSGTYSQWNNNHTYGVVDIQIDLPGNGYNLAPQITITGGGGTGATAHATTPVDGKLTQIVIDTPGTGYTSTPAVIINGTGSGAVAYPILKNVLGSIDSPNHNLVRSISTKIKFDRVNYTQSNTFVFWDNVTSANVGDVLSQDTILVLNNKLFKLANAYTITSTLDFPVGNVASINSSVFNNANDRIIAHNGFINLATTQSGIDYPGVKVDGNTFTGNIYDSTISSTFTSNVGIAPSDIIVDGGKYYDTYNSHAPEEMVPGIVYDSLNVSVYDDSGMAWRVFKDMSNAETYRRIANQWTTTLAQPLYISNTHMVVTDISHLPDPNPTLAEPGLVYVNGEKIYYYTIDRPNNSLGQLRRAVDGTGAPLVHATDSVVRDGSMQQDIPAAIYTRANIGAASVTYQATEYVSRLITLTSPITANIGEYILQKFGNLTVAANLKVLENVVNSNAIPIITVSGAITTQTNTFSHVGTSTSGNIIGNKILGNVSSAGTVTVAADSVVGQSTIWYTPGVSTATNGNGLIHSSTIQTAFLLASEGTPS